MINLLLGAPGGGKSYEAVVHHVLPALQRGRKVVTNLPLKVEAFGAIDPAFPALIEIRQRSAVDGARVFSVVADYSDPWRHPEGFGPLFVIDECHMALPVRLTSRDVEEWFSMHRHHNVDVLLITQSYGKISTAVRDLVQMVYRVRKNVALGSTRSYTRKVQDGLRGEVVNTSIRRYEKRYFGLYTSHTQGVAAQEFNAADVRPLWRHWSVIGAALCIGLGVSSFLFLGVKSPWTVPAKDLPAPPGPDLLAVARAASAPAAAASVPAPASAPDLAAVASSSVDPEPFAKLGVHLVGVMRRGAAVVWTFALSQNGQYQTTITDAELIQAGYTWEGQSICSGLLKFGSKVRPVVCDSPRVSLGVGAGPGS